MDITENQGFSFFRQLTKTTQKLLKNLLVRIKNRLEHCGISFLSKSGIKKPFFIYNFFKLNYFVSNYIAFIIIIIVPPTQTELVLFTTPPPAFYPFLMTVCWWGRGGGTTRVESLPQEHNTVTLLGIDSRLLILPSSAQ